MSHDCLGGQSTVAVDVQRGTEISGQMRAKVSTYAAWPARALRSNSSVWGRGGVRLGQSGADPWGKEGAWRVGLSVRAPAW